jgi:sec-independent protein translocase protein TatA
LSYRTRTLLGPGLPATHCYSLGMPFGIGIWELLILLLVLLLVFGPKRLPEMGRQLGKGMREFKDSVTGDSNDDEAAVALPPAEPVVPAAPAAPEQRERDTVS